MSTVTLRYDFTDENETESPFCYCESRALHHALFASLTKDPCLNCTQMF